MQKLILILAGIMMVHFTACNNSSNKDGDTKEPHTKADSLMEDVMDGHDVGMSKYGKLQGLEKQVQAALDSIAKLPAKAKQAAAPLKARLDSAAADLSYAIMAMDKWMEEFNMDSAINNMEERVRYLTDEKMKVGKIKVAIQSSLQQADSILKARF